jgi:hypothetical protein
MPDNIEVSSDIGLIVDLIALPHSDGVRADKLVEVRGQQARCRTAIEEYTEQLDGLYNDIARSGHNANWLVQAAEIVRRRERAEREKLRPGIEVLKQKLAARQSFHDAEARRLIEATIAMGEAWLSLPAALYKKLLQLADERRTAAETIRHARPVEGDIDYEALTQEIVARFPRILAALAK